MNLDDFDPNAEAEYDGIFGLPFSPEQARVVLVPVPFDATTSYRRGTSAGPAAIRRASWQVDLHDIETGDPWREGIAMLDVDPRLEAWNRDARAAADEARASEDRSAAVTRVDAISREVTATVAHAAAQAWDAGQVVGVVGGDHSCPLGAIQVAAQRVPGLGVLHIDAHADLRVAFEGFEQSHASIMHNVLERCPGVAKLVQVGVRDVCSAEVDAIEANPGRIRTFFDAGVAQRMCEGEPFSAIVRDIVAELPQQVWVSFDIDGLDPSLCPRTGTPVPGGLTFQQACYLLAAVPRSGRRLIGFDLCEVASEGEADTFDAMVGARMLYKLVGWTLRSRG